MMKMMMMNKVRQSLYLAVLCLVAVLSGTARSAQQLELTISFDKAKYIPAVMVVYWPEDNSLKTPAMMDHKDGHFTEKVIVARQGSVMSLRNSDDVGHTIYVKDRKHKIRWQLDYMPPASRFEQELFWPDDVFVELRCRLHLYMSAWAGSITSRYYTVVEFDAHELKKTVTITDFPADFRQIKIWMPKLDPLHISLNPGEKIQQPIERKKKVRGHILIKRD